VKIQEQQMGFKSKIFDTVRPCLETHDQIELYNGTLFLDCSEKTARQAFSELFTKVSTMIQINKVGPDSYAIDFVAEKQQIQNEVYYGA
jgi:hypothetical protein